MRMQIQDQLKTILIERFNIDPALIHPTVSLQKELKLDSMDAVDLLLAVNDVFSIQLPEEMLGKIHTLNDLTICVEQMLARKTQRN